jgi:hypothetical protein
MSTEHADLVEALSERRWFLRATVRELSDEQAGRRTTASELCLGGLIKHVPRPKLRGRRHSATARTT